MFSLVCTNPSCGIELNPDNQFFYCPECNAPLEVSYPKLILDRDQVERKSGKPALHRYQSVLPHRDFQPHLFLGEGNTALVPSISLGSKWGVNRLYFKDERLNPTGSFKDRGTASTVQYLTETEISKICTISSGNMGLSVAAYAARTEYDCTVFVSEKTGEHKLAPISIHEPRLVRVSGGNYGEIVQKIFEESARSGIYLIYSDNPYRLEGQKTTSYEIWEQLGFTEPDVVVVPTSSGGFISSVIKGFSELFQLDLIERIPEIVAVQMSGCAPIAKAFQEKNDNVEPWQEPDTLAGAISNPLPHSGDLALRKLRKTGGRAIIVDDSEALEAQSLLAREEGIFGQPAAAVATAAIKKMRSEGDLNPESLTVSVISGEGLKDPTVFDRHDLPSPSSTSIDELEQFFT
ncbi:MAG: threonine synthase [Candidatus Acetothermia bacterium]